MSSVQVAALPVGALLERYSATGAYTDCYEVAVPGHASLAEFMAAFYTTPVFKVERWLLAHLARYPSTDEQALSLAKGQLTHFAAWQVEARESGQAILAAGRTRSWLMVRPAKGGATSLFFGSAVVPRRRGGLGWSFGVLLGFHRLYSRVLLASAARRLTKGKS